MGEIADMMLDGTLCVGCGVSLAGVEYERPPGHPVQCATCKAADERMADHGVVGADELVQVPAHVKVRCPVCERMVKACGLKDHRRAKHSGEGA